MLLLADHHLATRRTTPMPGGTGVNTNTALPDTNRLRGSTDGPWASDGKEPPASRLRGGGRRRSVPHLLLGALLVLVCA